MVVVFQVRAKHRTQVPGGSGYDDGAILVIANFLVLFFRYAEDVTVTEPMVKWRKDFHVHVL